MRESGYYWVKTGEKSEWQVMSYDDYTRLFREDEYYYFEENKLHAINETRIKNPDELLVELQIKQEAKIFAECMIGFVDTLKTFNPNGYPKNPDEK